MSTGQRVALSPSQCEMFRAQGYVKNLPALSAEEVAELHENYVRLRGMLGPDRSPNVVNWWHKRNDYLYRVCTHPQILDYVECILGPDFYLWGSQFFVKEPGDGTVIPWHQDAQYWPLVPMKAVTVFLAVTDCQVENACMRVVAGTHQEPPKRHEYAGKQNYVLQNEIPDSEIDESRIVDLTLKAGEISLHTDALVHGSGPNNSQQPRIAFTMRFSSTDVKCDLSVWPTFKATLVRGEDRYHHNPPGIVPTEYGVPECKFPP